MSVYIPLSMTTYPRECLERAIADCSHIVVVEVQSVLSGICSIRISAMPSSEMDEQRSASDFLNYLLDLSAESYLGITRE